MPGMRLFQKDGQPTVFHPLDTRFPLSSPAVPVCASLRTGLILKAGGRVRTAVRSSGKFEFFCAAADTTSVGLESGAVHGSGTGSAETDFLRNIARFALLSFPVRVAPALRNKPVRRLVQSGMSRRYPRENGVPKGVENHSFNPRTAREYG